MDCFRQLTTMSWMEVLQSGGRRGNKAGLGYTTYKDSALRGASRPQSIGPDIVISAVRAGGKQRIFGFHLDHVFYVLWFDRNHKIVPA